MIKRLLGLLTATVAACAPSNGIVSAREFRLMDGVSPRASLRTVRGVPELALLDARGQTRLRAALDATEQPSVTLYGTSADAKAVIEVDDKGSHVLLRGPQQQESYLFQRFDGISGLVLVDRNGKHRGELKLDASGIVDITLFDAQGASVKSFRVDANGEVHP